MWQLDYIKENKKYKHLTIAERSMIQRWINIDHKSNQETFEAPSRFILKASHL